MSLKFKRHYPILLLLILVVSVLIFAFGQQRVIAYTTQVATQTATPNAQIDYSNDVSLFDDSLVHSIQVIISDEDYQEMLTTYQETGLKEYYQADVIIDGVRINDVGIRLKGNASLRTALGGGPGGGGDGFRPNNGDNMMPFPGGQPPEGFDGNNIQPFPNNVEQPEGNVFQMPENAEVPEAGQGQDVMRFNPTEQNSGEVKIPFMIKFDEYVEGQTYQGYTAISIRNYGVSGDASMLQEPVTNEIAQLVGLPATDTVYTGFRFNDEEETLYVVSELVNQEYLDSYFENSNGVLYKAELGSTLNYEGEDPSLYAESFTQQTRVNDADLAPLIKFMRFLSESDDATIEKELPNYLDVDAFATYLAINALLVNTDSMIGMNNNYYLYYDDVTGQFTILMWDANESLAKLGGSATYDVSLTNTQQGRGGGRGGPGGGSNALLTRFMANATFKALYEEKLVEVYEQAFATGAISDVVEKYATLIHSVNDDRSLVDISAYDQAVEKIKNFISQRKEYLQTLEIFIK